jgi:hypothetical protein
VPSKQVTANYHESTWIDAGRRFLRASHDIFIWRSSRQAQSEMACPVGDTSLAVQVAAR